MWKSFRGLWGQLIAQLWINADLMLLSSMHVNWLKGRLMRRSWKFRITFKRWEMQEWTQDGGDGSKFPVFNKGMTSLRLQIQSYRLTEGVLCYRLWHREKREWTKSRRKGAFLTSTQINSFISIIMTHSQSAPWITQQRTCTWQYFLLWPLSFFLLLLLIICCCQAPQLYSAAPPPA